MGLGFEELTVVREALGQYFEVKSLGECSFFLGMEIERDKVQGTLKLSQKKYVRDLLQKWGMEE